MNKFNICIFFLGDKTFILYISELSDKGTCTRQNLESLQTLVRLLQRGGMRFLTIDFPIIHLPTKAKFLNKIQTKVLKVYSLLLTVTSTSVPWDFYFFKLTIPLAVSTVQLLYSVKETGGKPDRKPYPLPYRFRNPYRNLTFENSKDYAKKPQRNCKFMNSASGRPTRIKETKN